MEREVVAFIDTNTCVTVGEEVFGATVHCVSCHLLIRKGIYCQLVTPTVKTCGLSINIQ